VQSLLSLIEEPEVYDVYSSWLSVVEEHATDAAAAEWEAYHGGVTVPFCREVIRVIEGIMAEVLPLVTRLTWLDPRLWGGSGAIRRDPEGNQAMEDMKWLYEHFTSPAKLVYYSGVSGDPKDDSTRCTGESARFLIAPEATLDGVMRHYRNYVDVMRAQRECCTPLQAYNILMSSVDGRRAVRFVLPLLQCLLVTMKTSASPERSFSTMGIFKDTQGNSLDKNLECMQLGKCNCDRPLTDMEVEHVIKVFYNMQKDGRRIVRHLSLPPRFCAK
jgi:hypothetical protein